LFVHLNERRERNQKSEQQQQQLRESHTFPLFAFPYVLLFKEEEGKLSSSLFKTESVCRSKSSASSSSGDDDDDDDDDGVVFIPTRRRRS